jgi:hypothetical protein
MYEEHDLEDEDDDPLEGKRPSDARARIWARASGCS